MSGNTQGVGTSFWSLIRRRTIPGFSFVCNALNLELMPQKRGRAPILTVTLPKACGLFWKASYTSELELKAGPFRCAGFW